MTTAAAPQRICALLRTGVKLTAYEVAARCYCAKRHAQMLLLEMRECGLVHRHAWHRPAPGAGARNRRPIAIWAWGQGADAPKPAKDTANVIRRRRHTRLTEQFGLTMANRILKSRGQGGTSVLRLEGETAYQRGVPRGKYVR